MVAKEAVFDVIIIAGEPWCLSLTHPLPTFQNIFTQRSPPTARPRVLQQPSNTTSSASAQCLCYYQRFLFRGFQFSVFSFQYRTRKKQQTNGAKEFVAGASPSIAAFRAN